MPNVSGVSSKWARFDRQSVVKEDQQVDHAASTKANLQEATKNLRNVVTANHFESTDSDNPAVHYGLKGIFAVHLGLAEVADVVTEPAKAVKNVVDAAAHGAASVLDGR